MNEHMVIQSTDLFKHNQALLFSDLDQFRVSTLSDINKLTVDKKLLFELDIFNIIDEVKDIYEKQPSEIADRAIRVTLLAYYMYWQKLRTMEDGSVGVDILDLFCKLISAATYCFVGENDGNSPEQCGFDSFKIYESRWESDEVLSFLMTYSSLDADAAKQELEILNYRVPLQMAIWETYCILKDSITLVGCQCDADYLNCTLLQCPVDQTIVAAAKSVRNVLMSGLTNRR